jgi:3-deoxy-D-manno-octulosonate 8-phosphate phosphatase (KDO 8-P phosphatase)
MAYPPEIWEKAEPIRLLILDVDGVLTDGCFCFDAKGETLKVFHVRDGHGIKMALGSAAVQANAIWFR